MIYLYIAIWLTGQRPSDYKHQLTLGPFETIQQCWSMGSLVASELQSKNDTDNVLGACQTDTPKFLEMKSMWGMVCASINKDDMCWFKNGQFEDPLK